MLVRKKQEENWVCGKYNNNKETCKVCGAVAKVLAEFNGLQVCGYCFEQAIQIRVGRKGPTIALNEVADSRKSKSQADVLTDIIA
jgi:hypothetical protein